MRGQIGGPLASTTSISLDCARIECFGCLFRILETLFFVIVFDYFLEDIRRLWWRERVLGLSLASSQVYDSFDDNL